MPIASIKEADEVDAESLLCLAHLPVLDAALQLTTAVPGLGLRRHSGVLVPWTPGNPQAQEYLPLGPLSRHNAPGRRPGRPPE